MTKETNLSLVLFAIENVSDSDLEYLSEAILEEQNFRKYQCKKNALKATVNSIKNSRAKSTNAQIAESSRTINTLV